MTQPPAELDRQRNRWIAYRERDRLTWSAGDEFAQGGLASTVSDLCMRLNILPSDPLADVVSLDAETLDWINTERPAPYEGNPVRWSRRTQAASEALRIVEDSHHSDGGWNQYLAIYRHGGLEVATNKLVHSYRDTRMFSLRHIVGMVWAIASLQAEACHRWDLSPPFELSAALLDMRGATLGGFAEGWAEPFAGLATFSVSMEDHVFIRMEIGEPIDF